MSGWGFVVLGVLGLFLGRFAEVEALAAVFLLGGLVLIIAGAILLIFGVQL